MENAIRSQIEPWGIGDRRGVAENQIIKARMGKNSLNSRRSSRPKVPRISRGGSEEIEEEDCNVDGPVSTVMVVVFLAVLAAHVWSLYGDFLSLAFDGVV